MVAEEEVVVVLVYLPDRVLSRGQVLVLEPGPAQFSVLLVMVAEEEAVEVELYQQILLPAHHQQQLVPALYQHVLLICRQPEQVL
jgi:hypothetical protein